MFKNYFLTACRTFWRNKTFSLINILGLSIGISAALVIFLIVSYEFSYDRFEAGGDRIYRVVIDASFSGTPVHAAAVPAPLGSAIQREITGVELTVPVFQFQGDGSAKVSVMANHAGNAVGNTVEKPVVYKKQRDVVFTNDQYFQLLSYKWLAGSPVSSLKEPFTVVLTESRARQYFPNISSADIIGRQITYNDSLRTTVSGIVGDLQQNTAFTGSEFISLPTISATGLKDDFMMDVWNDWMAYSNLYVKIAAGSSKERTETQLKGLLKKYVKTDKDNPSNTMDFRLQPLSDMHFNPDYHGFGQRISTMTSLYGLLAISAFLLLLGCINFINLSTAQASRRAKEIGIRKTMGSSKTQLIGQFLGETLFTVTLATIVSIALTPLLLTAFGDFIPRGLHAGLLQRPGVLLFLFLLIAVVSFLSGIYPALVLSGYNPVLVLKNQLFSAPGQKSGVWIRKTLTVSQFVIAQFFIIATVLVGKQIHYALNKDMGFSKEATLTFETPFDTVATNRARLLNEIKAMPEVALASVGYVSPAGGSFANIKFKGREDLHVGVQIRWGDSNYLKLYGIKILAGRNTGQSDTIREFLINETYAKALGFQHPQEALNKQLTFNGKDHPIVGVIRDFHEASLHEPITPLVFAGSTGSAFHIRLMPGNADGKTWKSGIRKIQKAFREVYPDADFEYTFLNDEVARWYDSDRSMSRLLSWATGLTIFISCLGLLGLVIYTTNRRTKEIGIRKVLGASVASIISILSGEFVKLVMLAFLIAAPLAWWASNKWLETFAYRTPISWWVFVLSAALLVVFALITLSIQTIRAAVANPVKSLRAE